MVHLLKKISIVVPLYNEVNHIDSLLEKLNCIGNVIKLETEIYS